MKPGCVRFPGECRTSSRGWAGRGAADQTPPTTELSNKQSAGEKEKHIMLNENKGNLQKKTQKILCVLNVIQEICSHCVRYPVRICSLCADSCETGKKILKSTHTYNFSYVYGEARTCGFLQFHFAHFLRDITSTSYLARPETAPLAYSSGSKRQQDPTSNRDNVKVKKWQKFSFRNSNIVFKSIKNITVPRRV